jgi:hypothetical protein
MQPLPGLQDGRSGRSQMHLLLTQPSQVKLLPQDGHSAGSQPDETTADGEANATPPFPLL